MSVVEVQDEKEFDACLSGESITVVHFSADWSPQSVQMNDVLEELSNVFQNRVQNRPKFLKVPAEKCPELSKRFQIISTPTILIFKDSEVKERVEGAAPAQVTKKLRALVEGELIANGQKEESLEDRLKKLIALKRITLFMKGSPDEPQCGFSKETVRILRELQTEFATFDILSDQEVRQGLKEYSKWPTYPQLYVDGELIGGLDIIKEMHSSGELKSILGSKNGDTQLSLDDRLKSLINKHPLMIFMKGNPSTPRCGFSRQLIAILGETGLPFDTFDILEDEEVRQGLKTYSNWPTYPQIYVKGELIGGLDIIKELKDNNQLVSTLKGE